jgi:hypothetical protein
MRQIRNVAEIAQDRAARRLPDSRDSVGQVFALLRFSMRVKRLQQNGTARTRWDRTGQTRTCPARRQGGTRDRTGQPPLKGCPLSHVPPSHKCTGALQDFFLPPDSSLRFRGAAACARARGGRRRPAITREHHHEQDHRIEARATAHHHRDGAASYRDSMLGNSRVRPSWASRSPVEFNQPKGTGKRR